MVVFTFGFTNDLQECILIVVNLLFNRWLFDVDAKFPIFGNKIGASRCFPHGEVRQAMGQIKININR